MSRKKKTQTQEGPEAPKDNVFSEPAAAQQAAASSSQATDNNAAQSQIPPDVAELIRSTLKVVIAQRRTYCLATTFVSDGIDPAYDRRID
jgi:hypothetical protein